MECDGTLSSGDGRDALAEADGHHKCESFQLLMGTMGNPS